MVLGTLPNLYVEAFTLNPLDCNCIQRPSFFFLKVVNVEGSDKGRAHTDWHPYKKGVVRT